jgi:hypothetical protein
MVQSTRTQKSHENIKQITKLKLMIDMKLTFLGTEDSAILIATIYSSRHASSVPMRY